MRSRPRQDGHRADRLRARWRTLHSRRDRRIGALRLTTRVDIGEFESGVLHPVAGDPDCRASSADASVPLRVSIDFAATSADKGLGVDFHLVVADQRTGRKQRVDGLDRAEDTPVRLGNRFDVVLGRRCRSAFGRHPPSTHPRRRARRRSCRECKWSARRRRRWRPHGRRPRSPSCPIRGCGRRTVARGNSPPGLPICCRRAPCADRASPERPRPGIPPSSELM